MCSFARAAWSGSKLPVWTCGHPPIDPRLHAGTFPPETFPNLLLLYASPRHTFLDLAADVMADNPGYYQTLLTKVGGLHAVLMPSAAALQLGCAASKRAATLCGELKRCGWMCGAYHFAPLTPPPPTPCARTCRNSCRRW